MTKHILPFRTHYLSLAVCKHIFLHQTHGLVFVRDAMRCLEAEKYGLSPLLLYALSIPGTAIRRMTFTPLDQPQALYATVHRLWAQEEMGFRGCPNALMLSRQVAASSFALGDRLALDGVEMIVANKGDKVSGAALRSAQQDAMWLGTTLANSRRIDTLARLEEVAAARHRIDVEIGMTKGQRQEQWAALPCRRLSISSGGEKMDWSPGSWMYSWEANLPPVSQPRCFYTGDYDGKVWLLTGGGSPALEGGTEEDELSEGLEGPGGNDQVVVALAKDLVACWPNSAAEIARSIGITARDLKWFLDGKAGLNESVRSELLSVLGIEWREYGRDGSYEASGPRVLVAKAVGAATRIYDEMSHGGDLTFSFEVVPEKGQPDPSWRYLLFQSYGGPANIMMFERGSRAAEMLNDKSFINFEGVRQVSSRLYRSVVALAARASRSPQANRREMQYFEKCQEIGSFG